MRQGRRCIDAARMLLNKESTNLHIRPKLISEILRQTKLEDVSISRHQRMLSLEETLLCFIELLDDCTFKEGPKAGNLGLELE